MISTRRPSVLVTGGVVWLLTAAAAWLLVMAPPAAAAPDEGGVGISLVDVPTTAVDDPRAQRYIVDHVAPGSTIERRVRVSNSTAEPQHITIAGGGAVIADGAFVPSGDNELSSWIRVRPESVDLAAESELMVKVTIEVPAAASAGEQYAAIWAQVASNGDAGVQQVNRVGVRVYLDVGPGGAPPSAFAIGDVTASGTGSGPPVVTAVVSNTGERALDIGGDLSLVSSDDAVRAGPFEVDGTVTLLPGESGPVLVTLPRELPGTWDAELTLTSGTLSHTVTGTITLGDGESALTPTSRGWRWPILIAVAALLVLAGATSWLLVRRRASRRRAATDDRSLVSASS